MKAWRIGSAAHPVFDGQGAALFPGRWNALGQPVIYAGASFAIAMLERLCYTAIGQLPAGDHYVEIDIPDDLVETLDAAHLAGWDKPQSASARAFGAAWVRELRSVALVVPSAVTRIDRNVVLNPGHPAFARVAVTRETTVRWDRRLFLRNKA